MVPANGCLTHPRATQVSFASISTGERVKLTTALRTDRDAPTPEALKTRWQGHSLQALVEQLAKTQGLKTRWQSHPLQALVELKAKTQGLKTRWQSHPLQALVELKAKTQALKTRWQAHPL